jgi:membrane dipeptidase
VPERRPGEAPLDGWLARARELHAANPVVDSLAPNWDSEMYLSPAMAELARRLQAEGLSRGAIQARLADDLVEGIGRDPELRTGYLAWWRRAGVTAASTSLLFSGPPSRAWAHVQAAIERSERLLAALADAFALARGPDDVLAARAAGRHAILFNLQNADPIGDDLSRVEALHGRGVRAVQLTYNLRNLYGDGCLERRDGGLSRFGLALVARLNRARIVIDTSHCSDRTTLDAVEASSQPVAITHAAARALSGHPRAKPDEVIRAVAEAGGYVGVVVMPSILTPSGRGASLDTVVDHVVRLIDLAGPGAVGIGTDWGKPYYRAMRWSYDGVAESLRPGEFDWVGWRPEHHFDPNEACAGIETWDLWPSLTAALLARGLSEEVVVGVIGGNFLRYWRRVAG